MNRKQYTLDRGQMLRALPKHLFWAAVLGAVAGPVLYFLKDIELPGKWNLLMAVPIGAVYVNAAVLPIALPGRHWSFGFIASGMLFMLMIAGMILAPKFPFAHGWYPSKEWSNHIYVSKINSFTWTAILTGGGLGLFYGLLAGGSRPMVLATAIGSVSGYITGLLSSCFFETGMIDDGIWEDLGTIKGDFRFDSAPHFAWQLALMLVILHLGACLGAAMGAGQSEGSKQKAASSTPPKPS